MINATINGTTYQDVSKLTATDGSTTATAALTETGVIDTPKDTLEITANGTGIDCLNYAAVDVKVPTSSGSTIIAKPDKITANGTYLASADSADGYSSVIVEVSGSGDSWTDVEPVDGKSDGGTACAYGVIYIPLSEFTEGTNIFTIVNKNNHDATNILAWTGIIILGSDGTITQKNGPIKYKYGTEILLTYQSIEILGDNMRFYGNANVQMNVGTEYKYRVEAI